MMIGILSVDDVREAPSALRLAIDWRATEALLDLASWLVSPPLDEPDLLGAEAVLREAITANIPNAKMRLVELRWFYERESASQDQRIEAFELLRGLLQETGDDAQILHLLGLLTCQGFRTEADPTEAVQFQKRAAALGSAAALFELSIHYATGLGVAQDDQAALDMTKQAANAGHPRAMYNSAAFFATGRYVSQDLTSAIQWYQCASDAGHPRATLTLAVMYARGEGVEKDADYADELFSEAEYMGLDVQAARESVGL